MGKWKLTIAAPIRFKSDGTSIPVHRNLGSNNSKKYMQKYPMQQKSKPILCDLQAHTQTPLFGAGDDPQMHRL